ncbi:MAG: glutathione S-transferase family protein [Pseudomonadota bacterium]|nr:glutathione S-transferase family protein [Pseudomonadota bacterium]
MILIGQFDSPFVRRVGIAMTLYEMAFEHRPWSVFGDGEQIATYNPLRRVPTLVLGDGTALIESATILLHLDEEAGPERALIAERGETRRDHLRLSALAMGLCDKLVALIYERALHETVSEVWTQRCEAQVADVLAVLEAERSKVQAAYLFGETPGHADIALACAFRFLTDAHPVIQARDEWPALAAHMAACETVPAFSAISQPFIPPA